MRTRGKIPEMQGYQEMSEFWDTHSLADYWDQTEPAEFDVSPSLHSRFLVPVDSELLVRVQEMARSRGVSTESLINLFLEQHLHELHQGARK